MQFARVAVLACLCLSVGSPAAPQGARGGHAGGGVRGDSGHSSSSSVPPSLPRWGIGPPPMGLGPLLPGTLSPVGRPGVDAFRATSKTYAPRFSTGIDGRRDGRFDGPRGGRRRYDGSGKSLYPGAVYIGG